MKHCWLSYSLLKSQPITNFLSTAKPNQAASQWSRTNPLPWSAVRSSPLPPARSVCVSLSIRMTSRLGMAKRKTNFHQTILCLKSIRSSRSWVKRSSQTHRICQVFSTRNPFNKKWIHRWPQKFLTTSLKMTLFAGKSQSNRVTSLPFRLLVQGFKLLSTRGSLRRSILELGAKMKNLECRCWSLKRLLRAAQSIFFNLHRPTESTIRTLPWQSRANSKQLTFSSQQWSNTSSQLSQAKWSVVVHPSTANLMSPTLTSHATISACTDQISFQWKIWGRPPT